MVVFTCSYCGDSVKKPSVVKHYNTKCWKKEPFLTCVDCFKDFRGSEHESHTKCVTEDERYSAKGYVPKPSQNKGERKQQAWQESIQNLLKQSCLRPDERDLIQSISKYENVPRKKTKFISFLSNTFRHFANKSDLIDRVWTQMEAVFKDFSADSTLKSNSNVSVAQKTDQQQMNNVECEEKVMENEIRKEKKRKKGNEEVQDCEITEKDKINNSIKNKKRKSTKSQIGGLETVDATTKNKKRKGELECVGYAVQKGSREGENSKTKNESNNMETDAFEPFAEPKAKKKRKGENLEEGVVQTDSKMPSATNEKKSRKLKKNEKVENKENCDGAVEDSVEENGLEKRGKKNKRKKNKKSESEVKVDAAVGSEKEKNAEEKEFDWKATILEILNRECRNNKIELEKLQKKVFKIHRKVFNSERTEKLEKKFLKKLKSLPQVNIEEDFVVLNP